MSIRTRTSGIMVPAYIAATGGASNGMLNNLFGFWELETLNDATTGGHNLSWNNQQTSTVGVAAGRAGIGTCASISGGASDTALLTAQNIGFNIAASDFSFCAWCYLTKIGVGILARAPLTTSSKPQASIYMWAGGTDVWYFSLNDSTAGEAIVTISGPLTLNVWHFLVGTCNRSTNFIYLSADNSLLSAASTSCAGITPSDVNQALLIGHGAASTTLDAGLVDQVGWWSRALSQDDVTYLYNSGNGRDYSEFTS